MPYDSTMPTVDFSATSTRCATPVNSPPIHVLPLKELAAQKQPIRVELDACEDPKNMSLLHKWVIVSVISMSALCVTCNSGVAPSTEYGIQCEFNISAKWATPAELIQGLRHRRILRHCCHLIDRIMGVRILGLRPRQHAIPSNG
ncbi:hypothetical protein OE88DRAFT_627596 [Heliocybe sulcata]|uniref:Uncharacterized protein n=1 Tax=Heliocybe sulcata TaxID=5364 RepID=A0A5C3NGA1_9AGAM|nr:hypothetical protein OE88DRAFT_627596 [Heliocybe sulcata]